MLYCISDACFFFFNDTATTEIYTLSLHDALPIFDYWILYWNKELFEQKGVQVPQTLEETLAAAEALHDPGNGVYGFRSEEHTSELQSRQYLVCRLLLEKKTKILILITHTCSLLLS